VLTAAWRPLLVVALLLAAAASMVLLVPPVVPPTIDGVVMDTQLARARTMERADVVLVGDSSGLAGVDPALVGARLGRRVESLATLGFAGPASYGRLLELALAAGARPSIVLVVIHPQSLGYDESVFDITPYERSALGISRRTATSAFRDVKTALSGAILRVVDLPFPGSWGRAYGRASQLRTAIERSHGALPDPTDRPVGASTPVYTLTDAVARRLPALGTALHRAQARCTFVALAPVPSPALSPAATAAREALLGRVRHLLAPAESTALDLPAALPAPLFASTTHLNARGRATYSQRVADLLSARRDCLR
jgi:hypothetical protein